MTFLLHLRLLSMQREDQIQLATSSQKHYQTKDMFKTFITCETWCYCCCCFWWCYWTICLYMWDPGKKRREKKNKQNDERKKTKCILVLLCASVISSVSRSLVRSFIRLSVDGHIHFFVRFIQWNFHIRKKTPHRFLFFFHFAAQGTLTCYIWTQSNILCALWHVHDS